MVPLAIKVSLVITAGTVYQDRASPDPQGTQGSPGPKGLLVKRDEMGRADSPALRVMEVISA